MDAIARRTEGEIDYAGRLRHLAGENRLSIAAATAHAACTTAMDINADAIITVSASGTTVLLVEQNAEMALQVADRAYVLESGRIVMSGTGKELAASEEIRKAYLGG